LKNYLFILFFVSVSLSLFAQEVDTTFFNKKYSFHFQGTVVNQYKPSFSVPYSGTNSFSNKEENETSFTSTLYLGAKLNAHTFFFINPEVAAGAGLSKVLGLGDAPNGETFRVTTTEPRLYIARAYLKKFFPISENSNRYFDLVLGKISLADFFDNNKYSHDPRTQFLNWGMMSNGAWDYPADTKGYTPSFLIEYFNKHEEYRLAYALMPTLPNGSIMDWAISKSGGFSAEYVNKYQLNRQPGAIRLLAFLNRAFMGNYEMALVNSIESTRSYKNKKFGFGLNIEQQFNEQVGGFFKTSWNDGKNETWAFTEIDQSISLGLEINGQTWGNQEDKLGIAYVKSGLTKEHQKYLSNGGLGFSLGDGKLNYDDEKVVELYILKNIIKNKLSGTLDYQSIINPGFNADRKGPVSVYSLRLHFSL
jgi:high affinity Mn2+ porin